MPRLFSSSGVLLGRHAGDDELHLDKLILVLLLGVEGSGGGAFDIGGCHTGGFDVFLGDTILDEEFFDRFGAFERD